MNGNLTKKQKEIIKEIDEIIEVGGLNHLKIENYEKEARIHVLDNIKNQLIRSIVISDYTFIDEHLNQLLSNYFFNKKKDQIKLWKTKKYQNFNYYILERLYLISKLDLVAAAYKVPQEIVNDIHKINDLRNGLAHTFFPENLKRNKPIYKGKNIFSIEGVRVFSADIEKINSFFMNKIYGVRL